MASKVEESIQRIKSKPNIGLIITDKDNKIIRSNYLESDAKKRELLRNCLPHLTQKARGIIRDLDPTSDLVFLRIQTKFNEFMVAPDKDHMLITVQSDGRLADK